MGELVHFKPKKECDAAGNLKSFIKLCRDELTVFGADLDWDSMTWDISPYVYKPGRRGRLAYVFSNFDSAGSKRNMTPMTQPFLDFAKAYMRYQHACRPNTNFGMKLAALRVLEKILIDQSSDRLARVEYTDPEALNLAINLVNTSSVASAYQIGNQLNMIANFLVSHHLVIDDFSWKNPIKKPSDHMIRVGKASEERRAKKIPSAEAFDALIDAYRMAIEPKDVLITSVVALLMCAPDRISEVFRLPANCEHTGNYMGEEAYGIRWWPAKGAEPMIKWLVKSMEDVAKEAIGRIRSVTEESRSIARWYEHNPDHLYLPQNCKHLRNSEWLTASDVSKILGIAESSISYWAASNGITTRYQTRSTVGRLPLEYQFRDLETAVLSMLPNSFPILDKSTDLKYSEALLVVPLNFFHETRSSYNCLFQSVSTDIFNGQLGAGEKHGKSSIFSRLGLKDPSGNIFKVSSHQFRHWLNTLAQNAGLSQLHIAKWSGRKDIRQNSYYDHVTPDELIAKVRELTDGKMFSPLAEFALRAPMTKEEFLKLAIPTSHSTEFGFCIHDWTMSPCDKYRDCLLCTEHLCIKGHAKNERVREMLVEAEEQLIATEDALNNGYFGADRWLDHHRKIVAVLREHVKILDDPQIPSDSVYQLTGIREYSPVTQAIEARVKLGDKDSIALRKSLQQLTKEGLALPHLSIGERNG
jgi:hypothetical protein